MQLSGRLGAVGQGRWHFPECRQLWRGLWCYFVAVGDFNGDGKSDLAVADEGRYVAGISGPTNSAVSILLSKGDGTFQTAVRYDARSPQSVAVGDFNRDGK